MGCPQAVTGARIGVRSTAVRRALPNHDRRAASPGHINQPGLWRPHQIRTVNTPSRSADVLTPFHILERGGFRGPIRFHSRPNFHALLDSLFKVLLIFPSQGYLFAIGHKRQYLPWVRQFPTYWGCIPKQSPELDRQAPRGATGSGHDGALTLSGAPFQGTWARSVAEDASPDYNSDSVAALGILATSQAAEPPSRRDPKHSPDILNRSGAYGLVCKRAGSSLRGADDSRLTWNSSLRQTIAMSIPSRWKFQRFPPACRPRLLYSLNTSDQIAPPTKNGSCTPRHRIQKRALSLSILTMLDLDGLIFETSIMILAGRFRESENAYRGQKQESLEPCPLYVPLYKRPSNAHVPNVENIPLTRWIKRPHHGSTSAANANARRNELSSIQSIPIDQSLRRAGTVGAGFRRASVNLGQVATSAETVGQVYVVRGKFVKSDTDVRGTSGQVYDVRVTWSSRYECDGKPSGQRLRRARKLGFKSLRRARNVGG
ncbi:hypothetical protein Tco_1227233 [Tanacetum coccineum]